MTAYNEDSGEKATDGSTCPAGFTLEVTHINGVQINRTNGFPVSVPSPKGSLIVYRDGSFQYEDHGIIAGHPLLGATVGNGDVTISLAHPIFDAEGNVLDFNPAKPPTRTIPASLTGVVADTTAPILISINPADGSTGAARDTLVDLIFSKPVAFGTGNITLRNVTGAVDIEAFNVVTEVGTGPGQARVSEPKVTLRTSAALPASSVISIRVDATAIDDLAGNSFAGIADDSQSFTTAAAAPPSTSTYEFGALTPSGQGGIPATSLTDASGHFQLTAGRVVLSAAGDTANLSGSPYSVTLDGAAVTIVAVANAIHVSTLAQAQAAAAAFQATPTIDSTIIMRDGDDWPWQGTAFASLTTAAMSGTFADANCTGFVTSVTPAAYDEEAVATLSGGFITVRPDTPNGAVIRCRMQLHSNGKIVFDGAAFEAVALSDGRNITENPVIANTNAIAVTHTVYLIRAGSGAAAPTGAAIFRNCRFGGTYYGTPVTRFGSYVQANSIGHFVVEDGDFDGYFNGIQGGAARHNIVRRNSFQRKILDSIRCFGTLSATTGGAGIPVYWETVKNTDWNPLGAVANDGGFHWGAAHADFTQCGTSADQVNVVHLSKDNIHYGEVDRSDPTARIHAYYDGSNGRPDFTMHDFSDQPERRMQGHQANFLSSGMRRIGEFFRDALVSNCRNAIVNGGTDRNNIDKCLMLPGMGNVTDALAGTDHYRLSLTPGSSNFVRDSIYFRIEDPLTGYTLTNNAVLVLTPTGPLSYGENFAGTFTDGGANGPQILFDTANGEAAFRADFIAKMTSLGGSLCAGKGPWS